MKKSEHNLNVINNFILYYTHDNPEMNCDEMYEAAKYYIAEDHVDGDECEDNNIYTTNDLYVVHSMSGEKCDKNKFIQWLKEHNLFN